MVASCDASEKQFQAISHHLATLGHDVHNFTDQTRVSKHGDFMQFQVETAYESVSKLGIPKISKTAI